MPCAEDAAAVCVLARRASVFSCVRQICLERDQLVQVTKISSSPQAPRVKERPRGSGGAHEDAAEPP